MKTIFTTPIGSRLHGLSTPDSDYDRWVIVDSVNRKKSMKMVHNTVNDEFVVSVSGFLEYAANGHHAALDAMFSPLATSSWLDAYRASYRVGLAVMHYKYHALIQNDLIYSDNPKHRRHALRMAINCRDAIEQDGRYNPVLSAERAALITDASQSTNFLEVLFELWPHNDITVTLKNRQRISDGILSRR